MKNTDIAAVILIASLSMLAAYFIADAVIGRPNSESVKVKTVDSITADVQTPDSSVFNKDAINPTVEVIIGGQSSGSSDQATSQNTTKQ
jgi:hypothetical protein